jgi:hypothetical protein
LKGVESGRRSFKLQEGKKERKQKNREERETSLMGFLCVYGVTLPSVVMHTTNRPYSG